uniref:Uncharacterized protein n=1 Tax=Anguilla anguilla TaxID=7936 RepID=A0A0E9SXB6_ANGAN
MNITDSFVMPFTACISHNGADWLLCFYTVDSVNLESTVGV